MRKNAKAASVIAGVDGPTSVFLLTNDKSKPTLKQRIHRFRYGLRKKRAEKIINANEHHTMEEVLAFATNECGLVECGSEDSELREEYEDLRASFLIRFQPNLLGEYAMMPKLESHEPEALRAHMQKVQEQIQRAKDVPKELFDIDYHKLNGKCEKNDESFFVLIETKYGYIGGSAAGDGAIKKLKKAMIRLYKYYGVTQDDIDNRTERYRDLVSELCR